MSTIISPAPPQAIEYPDNDGNPMAENTLQFEWIVTIEGGLDAFYRNDPDVFVAGDLLWYPVEGKPKIRTAPDTMIAFGRPKGRRGSYKQWEEGGIPPQVVFEILSPGNRFGEMLRKFRFYERHGVEEYYIYNPDTGSLEGYGRAKRGLKAIPKMAGFVSPRLGIRFEPGDGPNSLVIIRPDGQRFLSYVELMDRFESADEAAQAERQRADEQAQLALAERQRADEQAQLALAERQRADEQAQLALAERQRADEQAQLALAERQRADEQAQLALAERQRAEQMAARLRELSIEPD